jgi:hypothetical protein
LLSKPYQHEHPLLVGQRDYTLVRAVIDTGDESSEATAVLHFRRGNGDRRVLRFLGVQLAHGVGAVAQLRGFLPVYVAAVSGRGWEPGVTVEVGDTDPGTVWFWAASVEAEPGAAADTAAG